MSLRLLSGGVIPRMRRIYNLYQRTLQDRRRIEREAFSGSLLGIVATNALELGVDIGVLDAVIMLGFPVTLASFVSFHLIFCFILLILSYFSGSSLDARVAGRATLLLY